MYLVYLGCYLKHIKVELELLTDINKVMFIKLGIKYGVSQCSNRYARANNLYTEIYNENSNIVHVVYLDAKNFTVGQ